jgi:hypothetical protein
MSLDDTGSNDERGLGRLCRCCLLCVYAKKPPKEMAVPSIPVHVIGIPKAMEVITTAKILRMQLSAA